MTKMISLKISDSLAEKLKEIAHRYSLTQTAILENAIEKELQRIEQKEPLLEEIDKSPS